MSTGEARAVCPVQTGLLDVPGPIFRHKPGEFEDRFNLLPFMVEHDLASSPLFEVPRLVSLAKRLWLKGKGRVVFQEANVPVDLRWDEIPAKALSFIEGISRIGDSGSWVSLKRIHEDPEYKALIDQGLEEMSVLTGVDLQSRMTSLVGSFFVSSPRSVTPYHIDHEANFLLQIHGERNLYVCDPNDRSVLSEEEIENYYTGDVSGARFSEESEKKAYNFRLVPGKGVHIPSKGPHWARGGEDYSIALSVNVCMKDIDLKARVYQVNHYLRKLKFQPEPPCKSAFKDRLKILALGDVGRQHVHINNYAMITRNVGRLDHAFRAVEKCLGRSNKA